jgi:hypothetical protein
LPEAPSEPNLFSLSWVGRLFSQGSSGIGVPTFFSLLILALVFGTGLAVGLFRSGAHRGEAESRVANSRPMEIAPVAYPLPPTGAPGVAIR